MSNLTKAVEGSRLTAINKGEQFSSFDVDAFEVPAGRDELWRFTPLKRLRGLHDGSAPRTAEAAIAVSEQSGVVVETVQRGDERLGQGGIPADRVAAQAFSSFQQATVVTVARGTQTAEPVEIAVTGPGVGQTAYGHLQIRVDELAEAVVVIDLRGSGTYADNVEFVVADAARMTVVWIADWADDMVHVSAHHARLGKDAVLRHVAVTLGGELVRMAATVRYDGPGGDAELLGLYFADSGQHQESRLLVDHSQPNCRSNVLYKGALQGDPDSGTPDARTVWIGDVLIRAEATGTDTFEVNRNLLLTVGARADSVLILEIETGEILGAGHASATGRFDDEQLFYLQARGIPEEQARRLVVRGFFGEIISKIGIPEIRDRLTDAIESELALTESKIGPESTIDPNSKADA
ncbi:MAG: Fe-S cluster assembly protein SufD [Mycobacterium sp.]|nr:MAG: Fe-S cluster assembly protein SufD [Mycobacterium sp.]